MNAPTFVFAHGAGAPSSSAWMERYAALLGRLGPVQTFDYDYMKAGKRTPDRLPKLVAAHVVAIDEAKKKIEALGSPRKLILIGKSMGGRVGCHASLEQSVDGLICLGYPLQGAGKTQSVRDAVLKDLNTPILFVQGTRDPLCPLGLLAEVRRQMRVRNELWVVESGNHSLEATKAWLKQHDQTQANVESDILQQIQNFCHSL